MVNLKAYFYTIMSATLGSNSKDTVAGFYTATIGYMGTVLGGWDKGMTILIILMIGDYMTGLLGAIKTRQLNSDVMYWGGIRKIVVLFVIALATAFDGWMNPDALVYRTIAIYFYIGREGLSIIENLGVLNVPLPQKLKDVLQQLNDKGEERDRH